MGPRQHGKHAKAYAASTQGQHRTFCRSSSPRRSCSATAARVPSSIRVCPRLMARRAQREVFLCLRVRRSCRGGEAGEARQVDEWVSTSGRRACARERDASGVTVLRSKRRGGRALPPACLVVRAGRQAGGRARAGRQERARRQPGVDAQAGRPTCARSNSASSASSLSCSSSPSSPPAAALRFSARGSQVGGAHGETVEGGRSTFPACLLAASLVRCAAPTARPLPTPHDARRGAKAAHRPGKQQPTTRLLSSACGGTPCS